MFKVQPEQLVARSGDGRCSVCQHVFNAFEHQMEIADEVTPVETLPEALAEPVTEELATSIEAEVSEPEPAVVIPPPPLPDHLFQRRRFVWPAALKTLSAALILVAIALLQTAFHFRAQVSAKFPESYPIFALICKPLHCTTELPHQAARVNIEDHRLLTDPEHDDVLVLESTLVNQAIFPQVYPLVELTLTDANNEAVAMRRFRPEEYLASGTYIAAGMAAHGTAAIRLALGVAGVKSSGYLLITKDEVKPPAND